MENRTNTETETGRIGDIAQGMGRIGGGGGGGVCCSSERERDADAKDAKVYLIGLWPSQRLY